MILKNQELILRSHNIAEYLVIGDLIKSFTIPLINDFIKLSEYYYSPNTYLHWLIQNDFHDFFLKSLELKFGQDYLKQLNNLNYIDESRLLLCSITASNNFKNPYSETKKLLIFFDLEHGIDYLDFNFLNISTGKVLQNTHDLFEMFLTTTMQELHQKINNFDIRLNSSFRIDLSLSIYELQIPDTLDYRIKDVFLEDDD